MTKRLTPAALRLRHRQSWESMAARCRANIYLVGSYITDHENALDVDIIAALPQDGSVRWFDRLKAQIKLSGSLSKDTGLPIDFKIQSNVQFVGTAADLPTLLLAEPGVPVVDVYYHDYEDMDIDELGAKVNAQRIQYGWTWKDLSDIIGAKIWNVSTHAAYNLTIHDLIKYHDWIVKKESK